MSAQRRVQQQAAFILHHRPFRDTSQILDLISRDHGKLAVVARGSRGAKSRLKGVLRPFMPLSMSWVIKSDLGTLTGAEVQGAAACNGWTFWHVDMKGDRVAIWGPNSPQWVFAFFGSLRAGAIPVPIDLRSDEGFVARVV